MPELPEVQTVADSVKGIIGNKIANFVSIWNNSCKNIDPTNFDRAVCNQKIIDVYRRWKFIVIKIESLHILCHLRMTGKLYIGDSSKLDKEHLSSYFKLDNGTYLIYNDIRKFGGFYLYKNLSELSDSYGMDPYDTDFTSTWLFERLNSSKRMIKAFLFDQSILAGLGNIYIDEVLWESKIDPRTHTNLVDKSKANVLHKAILKTLNNSIKHHGTTIDNFSFDLFKTGSYKNQLKVYMRDNKTCKRCLCIITKIRVAGRGTYICNKCQK